VAKRILRILYQPYKWLVYFPIVALGTFFFGTLALVLLLFFEVRFVSQLCGGGWGRLLCWATPVGVKVTGRRNLDKTRSCVIVANHQSHYDILVIYGWIGVDFKWVMKKELRKIPILGIASHRGGHIFIDRSNNEAARATLREAKKKISGGTSIVFFPEGTRTTTGSMGEFKKGAFVMALDLGIPVVPVTIAGSRRVMPSKTLDIFPGRIHMIIHPPIDVARYTRATLEDLMDEARLTIQAGLEKYDRA